MANWSTTCCDAIPGIVQPSSSIMTPHLPLSDIWWEVARLLRLLRMKNAERSFIFRRLALSCYTCEITFIQNLLTNPVNMDSLAEYPLCNHLYAPDQIIPLSPRAMPRVLRPRPVVIPRQDTAVPLLPLRPDGMSCYCGLCCGIDHPSGQTGATGNLTVPIPPSPPTPIPWGVRQ